VLLCPARRDGQYGIAVVEPDAAAGGVSTRPVPAIDLFRPVQDVAVRVSDWRWLATDHTAFTEAVAAGAVVLAAEMVGGARACLDRMVTYSKQRRQFGKQIGTFQSLKHRMVDVLVEWEAARAATYRAAKQLDASGRAGGDPADCIATARMAKAAASDALRVAARLCIHVHGATGVTWENPIHFYLKRWASSARLFGEPDQHRVHVYEHAVQPDALATVATVHGDEGTT
jgi:alkylation response protein AidB-like acyl-CoA dehydrogenase